MWMEYKEKDYLYKQVKRLNWRIRSLALKWPYTINKDWNKVFSGFTLLWESIYKDCCIERWEDYVLIDKDKFKQINKWIINKYKKLFKL